MFKGKFLSVIISIVVVALLLLSNNTELAGAIVGSSDPTITSVIPHYCTDGSSCSGLVTIEVNGTNFTPEARVKMSNYGNEFTGNYVGGDGSTQILTDFIGLVNCQPYTAIVYFPSPDTRTVSSSFIYNPYGTCATATPIGSPTATPTENPISTPTETPTLAPTSTPSPTATPVDTVSITVTSDVPVDQLLVQGQIITVTITIDPPLTGAQVLSQPLYYFSLVESTEPYTPFGTNYVDYGVFTQPITITETLSYDEVACFVAPSTWAGLYNPVTYSWLGYGEGLLWPVDNCEPSPTPTATPTPTETPSPTPTAESTQVPGNSTTSNASAPSCNSESPKAPNLTGSVIGSNVVHLSWNSVIPSTHYMVRYGTRSGNYIYGAPNIGKVTSFDVNGLSVGTRYYFQVAAVNDCQGGSWSNEIALGIAGTSLEENGGSYGVTLGTTAKISPKPSPRPSPTGQAGVEGTTSECTQSSYPWWLPLLIQLGGGFVYVSYVSKRKKQSLIYLTPLLGLAALSQIIHNSSGCNCATGLWCGRYWLLNLGILGLNGVFFYTGKDTKKTSKIRK